MSRQAYLAAPRHLAYGDRAARGVAAPKPGKPLWRRLLLALVAWQSRQAARYDALALDERTLRDIGLNRTDIAQAMGRPWRRL